MQQEMSFGVVGKLSGFIKSTLELATKGNVAAFVDGKGDGEIGGMDVRW